MHLHTKANSSGEPSASWIVLKSFSFLNFHGHIQNTLPKSVEVMVRKISGEDPFQGIVHPEIVVCVNTVYISEFCDGLRAKKG